MHRSFVPFAAAKRAWLCLSVGTWQMLAILAAATVGCERANEFKPPPPPKVTVAQPVEQDVVNWMEFTGATQATARVELRARVNGYLKEIRFKDGATVKQDEVLFVIEPAEYEVAKASAQAELRKTQTAMQLEQAEFNRVQEAFRKGAVTPSERDIQAAELASAQANVDAAQAALDRAELDLSYTKILAPMDGRIGRHLVDVGNLVLREQTLLAIIESLDPIDVYFNVSESDLLRFMAMMRQNTLPDPNKNPPVLHMGLANEAGFPNEGYLDFREFGVNPNTGTVLRRGRFHNTNGTLVPGLFVRIRASIGDPTPRLLVEERALGSDQRGDYLLVVNHEQTVEYRPVKLGISVGSLRVVEAGIEKTDWVVVNGLQRALPGAKVDPEQTPMVVEQEKSAATGFPPSRE